MEYQEYPAGTRLAPFVDCLWTLDGSAEEVAGVSEPVLPDGRSELIVHFGEPFERRIDGGFERQAPIVIAGQLTGQLVLRPTARAAVLGVRFQPFGAAALLDIPQHQLAGMTPTLDAVSRPLSGALGPVRSMTDRPADAVAFVRGVLERAMRPERVDVRLRAAVHVVRDTRGLVQIEHLAGVVGMSRRHLERRFLDVVGMSPKRLARITRFQAALQALRRPAAATSGAATAAQFGYADQPHFIREFRDLAGCTPAEHLLQQARLTGFFISGSR